MIAYTDGDDQRSLDLFQEAFKVINADSENDLFYAAAAAFRVDKDDVAEELIRRAVSGANANIDYFRSFYEFKPYREKELFARVERDYDELVNQYYSNLSYPRDIEDEIMELIERDQRVRTERDEDMRVVDSLNITRLMEITSKYGWISRAELLIWHHRGQHREDNRVWNYFRPLINREIEEGKIRKGFWTRFDDELSIRRSGHQIYGMYQNQFPINEIETVDERRKELGLPPLWYMNKVYGQDLPDQYNSMSGSF